MKWSGLQMKMFSTKEKTWKDFTQSRLDLLWLEGTWFEKLYQVMPQSTVTLGVNDFLLTSEDETWR